MKYLNLLILCLIVNLSFGQTSNWQKWQPIEKSHSLRIKTTKAEYYSLDLKGLKNQISNAPEAKDRDVIAPILSLPMPGGKMIDFNVISSSALAPGLASKYPEIKSYIIKAINDERVQGRIDVTYQGFHAMIQKGADLVFIDPALDKNTINYIVYKKTDLVRTNNFACLVNDESEKESLNFDSNDIRVSDNNFRTYRIAISCTGEYAQFHGGTKEMVVSAMNTTINRVNFVYEHDFAVRFEIVDKNDTLIYLNPSTDPYDNNDVGTQLDENQNQCDEKIGSANYDIGHIFSTGGGGLAGYAVVCKNNRKAGGGTGSGSPVNDAFDIDYVAHEIGHQMSGSHTQNNNCNRDDSASFEPGSASTIMGYAGICAPDVQQHSDAYFHGHNILEMGNYIVNGTGNSCPSKTILPGTKPVINTTSGNHTIPKLTPFEMEASATSEYRLLYWWDQYDNEAAEVQPPVPSNKLGPLFRSYDAVLSGIRTFPKIEYIVNNSLNTWESLSAVARDINFVVTVREDITGGARHSQAFDKLTVDANKGPFLVDNPNEKNITWFSSVPQTVTWDVSLTDQSPINCSRVNILLSKDGGYTYPYSLLETENDGSAEVILPQIVGDSMRIKVGAVGNVFFDISNNNFTIKDGFPPFAVDVNATSLMLCALDTLSFYVSAKTLDLTPDTILVSTFNTIQGIEVLFSNDTLFTEDSILVTIINKNAVTGVKQLQLKFSTPALNIVKSIEINSIALPLSPVLNSPSNYSENVSTQVQLKWNPVTSEIVTYTVEIAKDKLFTNIVATLEDLSEVNTGFSVSLESGTTYYWRVRTLGQCGFSNYSASYVFRTEQCTQIYSQPFMTTPINAIEVTDTINVSDIPFEKVSSISINAIRGSHNEVSGLSMTLKNNDGLESILFDKDCSGDRIIDLSFDDRSEIEGIPCDENVDILGLGDIAIKPTTPLSVFNGSNANNNYVMLVNDDSGSQGGVLEQWGLTICGAAPVCSPLRIPEAIKIYKANVACTDGEGWTHYSISADKNPLGAYELMIMSLKLNQGDEVLPEAVSIRIPTTPLYSKLPNAQYVNDASKWFVMNRHWLLTPAVQPTGLTGVRFYFGEQEAQALFTNAGIDNIYDSLKVFSIFSNGVLNPNPVNKHVNIQPTDVKLHDAEFFDYNIKKYVEFYTTYLADGCIGAGSQFKVVSSTNSSLSFVSIALYPNPANDEINLKFSQVKDFDYVIQDILGNQLIKGKVNNSEGTTINTADLSSGSYFIRFKADKVIGTNKFTVIK